MSLLDQCECYEPDDDEMKELFEAERDVNAKEATTVQSRAASWVFRSLLFFVQLSDQLHRFYTDVMREKCSAKLPIHGTTDFRACDGDAVYRNYSKKVRLSIYAH